MRTLLLLLLLQPPAQDEPIDPKQLATIEGTVLNASTGLPIPKVQLTLRPNMQGVIRTGPPPVMAGYAATTNAEGKFLIERIDPGNYNLHAERQGFISIQYGARTQQAPGTVLSLTAGLHLKELNFKLAPHAILTGKVTADDGEPLYRAQIQAARLMRLRGKRQLAPVGYTETNDFGEFRLAGLPPGRYYVTAQVQNNLRNYQEIVLRNAPAEEYPKTFFPAATDESAAKVIEVASGQTINGIDIRIKKIPVFHIRGKVTGITPPVANIRVSAIPRGLTIFSGNIFSPNPNIAKDGSFDLSGQTPGTYDLVAIRVQGAFRSIGRVAVEVSSDHVSGVNIPVSEGIILQGKVRIDGDKQQIETTLGQKIALESLRVSLNSTDGPGFNNPNGQVNAEGEFRIEQASLEKYRLNLYPLPPGLYLKAIDVGGTDVLNSGIDLTAGQIGPLEVVLGVGTGTLSGQILNDRQSPATTATVTLIPEPYNEDRFDLMRTATPDQQGNFKLLNLTPGTYRLYAWEAFDMNIHSDPEYLKTQTARSKTIAIKPFAEETVTLNQIP